MRKYWLRSCMMIFCLWVMLCPISAVYAATDEDGVHITLLHTNDMHARLLPADDFGRSIGLPEIAAAIKAEKRVDKDVLAVDAGDTLHGMPSINISRGENMVQLLNAAGYDFLVPGNHDYNYGAERLQVLAKQMKGSVLSANTVRKKSGRLLFPAYQTVRMDDVRMAVIGLTTPETMEKTNPSNVQDIRFLDPVATTQKLVNRLRENYDVIIVVAHLGLDKSSVITSEQLAQQVKGIDVIVDGHSHTELPHGKMVGDTLIVQTGCYDHYLGEVDLVVKDHQITSKTARLLDAAAVKKIAPMPDVTVERMIADLSKKNQALLDMVVTQNSQMLSADRAIVRTQEAVLGNLSADAMRKAAGADAAVLNGGAIRHDLPAGAVTKGDILAVYPFGNTLMKLEVSGDVLRQALEHSVSEVPAEFGGFLQVSGLQFQVDAAAPAGQRVKDIMIGGKPLSLQQTYTLAMPDFLFAGGDGYTMFKGMKVVGEYGTLEEVMIHYFNQAERDGIQLGRIQMQAGQARKAA